MHIGERLKQLRSEMNYTQAELASYIGVAQNTLANYENGNRAVPDEVKLKIADFFGVSIDFLLARSDNPRYEEFIDRAEVVLLSEAEKLIGHEKFVTPNSQAETLRAVGKFIIGFYNAHKHNYASPIARLRLIRATRELARQHLHPKTIKVRLITPTLLRKAGVLDVNGFLQERGMMPEEVLDTKTSDFGEKTDLEKLLEELNAIEEGFQRSTAKNTD